MAGDEGEKGKRVRSKGDEGHNVKEGDATFALTPHVTYYIEEL